MFFNKLQVTVAYNKDTSPNKLNLGVGAYRTEVGISYFLFLLLMVLLYIQV